MQPSEAKSVKTFEHFETFNDPELENTLMLAKVFCATAMEKGTTPYWFTMCGRSDTGKTFLANIVFERLRGVRHLRQHPTLAPGVARANWPRILSRLYNRDTYLIEELSESNLLFLDELSPGTDKSGFERDCMARILLPREGRWTILTSNHPLKSISEKIDARIASRMTRSGSVTVELTTKPFSER